MGERLSDHQDPLEILQGLESDEVKEKYIVEVIIPAMNERRRRLGFLSGEESKNKLWAPPTISGKQGEWFEYVESMKSNELLGVDEALEIADIIYYILQPNMLKHDKDRLQFFLWIGLGDTSCALDFCIIKYLTRLQCGDEENYKQIESYAMEEFFIKSGLPESLIHSPS